MTNLLVSSPFAASAVLEANPTGGRAGVDFGHSKKEREGSASAGECKRLFCVGEPLCAQSRLAHFFLPNLLAAPSDLLLTTTLGWRRATNMK